MTDLPTAEETIEILEADNAAKIRKYVGLDTAALSDEKYLEASETVRISVDPESFKDKDTGKFSAGLVAHHILELRPFATPRDSKDIMAYQPDLGIYVLADTWVAGLVEEYLREKANRHFVSEVLGHIERRSYRDREEFDSQPGLVVTNEIVLDLLTETISEWDSARLDTVRLPVNYDSEAECPAFKEFVSQVLRPEDAQLLQEIFGYCLWKAHPIHRASMFVGDGDNGKSTAINVLKALLGSENIAALPLQELSSNRFAKVGLFGKLANLCADIPSEAVRATGTFKMLTGGDTIPGEIKGKQRRTNFVNFAKLIFSANRVPPTDDESAAFYRRWNLLDFPNTFQKEEQDPQLLEKLTTPKELSGILNWAIQGLRRLKEQGEFSNAPSIEEARQDYIRRSQPVAAFVEDRADLGPDFWIIKDDLFEAYLRYAERRKLPALRKGEFTKDLQRAALTRAVQKRVGGKRRYVYEGIRLRDHDKDSQPKTPVPSVLGVLPLTSTHETLRDRNKSGMGNTHDTQVTQDTPTTWLLRGMGSIAEGKCHVCKHKGRGQRAVLSSGTPAIFCRECWNDPHNRFLIDGENTVKAGVGE